MYDFGVSFLKSITSITLCIITSAAGFSNWIRLVGGHFRQNDQKLHENYKINILVAKQWGSMGETSQFFGLWGDPPIGKTLSCVAVIYTTFQFSQTQWPHQMDSYPYQWA